MDRRLLLKVLGTSAGVAFFDGLSPFRWSRAWARGIGVRPKNLVIMRLEGGWDVSLGPDGFVLPPGADEKDMSLEYRPEDLIRAGGLILGPTMSALAPWFDRMAVVNGLFMSSNNVDHAANLDYMACGDAERKQADFSADFARRAPALFGVLSQSGVRTLDRGVSVTRVSAIRDMNADAFSDVLVPPSAGDSSYEQAVREMQRNSAVLKSTLSRIAALPADLPDDERQAQTMAIAFTEGVANVADLRFESYGSLDTHSNHARNHAGLLSKIFASVASHLKVFQRTPAGGGGESLLDHTVFLLISEFSRTPALNSSAGKDHNPLTNSAILIGRGIRGGTTWGRSRLMPRTTSGRGASFHVATMVDANNRSAHTREESDRPEFDFIRPGHILSTVLSALEIAPSELPLVDLGKTPAIRGVLTV